MLQNIWSLWPMDWTLTSTAQTLLKCTVIAVSWTECALRLDKAQVTRAWLTAPFTLQTMALDSTLSLMQKVRWSLEIVTILNCSVLWTDMDQYFYQNPLLFLFDRLPLNSDAVLLSEYWNSANAHKGDFCRLDSLGLSSLGKGNCSDRDRACANVTCAKDFQPSFKPGRENLVRCCDGPINGGQFLINPTPGGKIFVSMWFVSTFQMNAWPCFTLVFISVARPSCLKIT
jgi:hypothetical protein